MSQRNRHTGHINAFKQRILDRAGVTFKQRMLGRAGSTFKCSQGITYRVGPPLKKYWVDTAFKIQHYYVTNTIVRVTPRTHKENK